ncbi:chaplin [Streptomyces sp. VRA16 Mangrove soil]|nr:chaplin [Streptomyces sp. VRA16 Mangrove soil]
MLSGNAVEVPLSVPVNLCGNTVDALSAANPASGNSCSSESAATAATTAAADTRSQDGPGYGEEAGTDHGGSEYGGSEYGSEYGGTQAPQAESTSQSGGLLSGNTVQTPLDIGLNLCGDTVDAASALNPAANNACTSTGASHAMPPVLSEMPPAGQDTPVPPPTGRVLPPVHPPVSQSLPQSHEMPRPVRHQHESPAPRTVLHPPEAHGRLAETGADQNVLAAASAAAGLLVGGGILYRRSSAAGR